MPDWIVKLTDESGAAVTDAEVTLVRESEVSTRFVHAEVVPKKGSSGADLPLMAHDSGGTYRLPAPLAGPAGDWRLVVRKDKRHTVIQPVTIATSDKGGFATTPRNLDPKGPAVEVAAVEIKTVHAGGTSTTTFLVRQLPHGEVVLMSGTQYSKAGEPLRTFAEGRRDALAGAKVAAARRIDDGTLVTIFSIDDRATLFFAKARGSTLGWVLVHRVQKRTAPAKAVTPGAPWPSKPDKDSHPIAIHPQDLYGYLHDIGASSTMRGRVREVSIFSHSFADGPILYNTNDATGKPDQRDPNDFDCRTKDWESPTLDPHDQGGKAMSSAGRWHIWGCNTNPELVMMTASANLSRQQKKADDELFAVNLQGTSRRYEARIDRRRVLRRHLEWLTSRDGRESRSYPGMLLSLGCDVFAALPGTWSNFSKASRSMFVDTDPGSWPIIEKYHKEEPALKAAFKPSSGIDGERYSNYRNYVAVNFPAVAARSAEYEFWHFKKSDRSMIRFHGGQVFGTSGNATVSSERIADVGSIVSSLAGKAGHRYVLTQTPDTATTAVLVVETGAAVRVFGLDRGTSGKFDTDTGEISGP